MAGIDWGAALAEKYRILAQEADARTTASGADVLRAESDEKKAKVYLQGVANDYDLGNKQIDVSNKQIDSQDTINRRNVEGEIQRTMLAEEGATGRNTANNLAMEPLRSSEATANRALGGLRGAQATGLGYENELARYTLPGQKVIAGEIMEGTRLKNLNEQLQVKSLLRSNPLASPLPVTLMPNTSTAPQATEAGTGRKLYDFMFGPADRFKDKKPLFSR